MMILWLTYHLPPPRTRLRGRRRTRRRIGVCGRCSEERWWWSLHLSIIPTVDYVINFSAQCVVLLLLLLVVAFINHRQIGTLWMDRIEMVRRRQESTKEEEPFTERIIAVAKLMSKLVAFSLRETPSSFGGWWNGSLVLIPNKYHVWIVLIELLFNDIAEWAERV